MGKFEMNLNTQLEVAVEVISAKIANLSNNGYTTEDKEMKILLEERKKMYMGDKKIINKIIEQYAPEIKSRSKGAN